MKAQLVRQARFPPLSKALLTGQAPDMQQETTHAYPKSNFTVFRRAHLLLHVPPSVVSLSIQSQLPLGLTRSSLTSSPRPNKHVINP